MLLHALRRGLAVLVLVVVLGGLWWYFSEADHAPSVVAPPPGDPPLVQTVTVVGERVPLSPTYLGQTEASQVVEIRARVDGFLQRRAFEEGEVVEPGELLYVIDPRSLEAELEVARSRRAAAEARRAQAQQDLRQVEQLVERNAATQQELEDAQTALQVAAAEVQLEGARIAQAELEVGYTQVESPIRGLIGESLQDVGAYVSRGGESLLAVVSQVDPIYVEFSVAETEALQWQAAVEAGQIVTPDVAQLDVRVVLADGREYPHVGHINFIDVRVDPTTGTREIRAVVPNPDMLLRPGQFVQATLLGAARTETVLVPQEAVMQNPTGATVYVVGDDGRAQTRAVELGEWYGDRWVIESGLAVGERVIVDRLMQVRPGMPVRLAATPGDGQAGGAATALSGADASAPGQRRD